MYEHENTLNQKFPLKCSIECQTNAPNPKEMLISLLVWKWFVSIYKLGHGRAVFGHQTGNDCGFTIKEMNEDLGQMSVILSSCKFYWQ